ncbi:hypothetical protein PAHAL_5G203500 [Panicum hallii]|uniref:Uncharacterized protein n=1 Tax=Panicum hallii TaxID=206008 RepID=A0A2T8IKN3_9POAL|nr:hypothetical protein PAHAL_5G203500 [Panicum hallii]
MNEYHLSARYCSHNGWTKEGWNCMATRLNNKYPVSKFSVTRIKNREQRLKKDHNILEPEIKMVTTIGEKWNELSEGQQKWRNRMFPYYDDLYDIYDDKDGMNTNDTNSTYGDPTSVPENSQNPSTNQKEDRLENSAPSGMSQHAKSAEKGPDKNRLRKNMDVVLESLDLKSKQIESYKQVKLAQMERNNPNNDPYCMAKCDAKLQELDILPSPELLKTINYLKKDKLNREIFMTLKVKIILQCILQHSRV